MRWVRSVRALRSALLTSSPIDHFQAASSHECEGLKIIHGAQVSHIYDMFSHGSNKSFIIFKYCQQIDKMATWSEDPDIFK